MPEAREAIDTGRPTCAAHLLTSLSQATPVREPYPFWLLADVLPRTIVEAITALPLPPARQAIFDGRRESNNSSRVYFTPRNQAEFSVCRETVDLFADPGVVRALEEVTGADLAKGRLRIEYCQDVDGFWLEPHCDIRAKLFTLLVYLSDDPNLSDAGTDIYDASPQHHRVAVAPYARNKGLIFIPSDSSWHGFSLRPIRGLRQSLIVNYVSAEWRSEGELAFLRR